MSQTDRRGPGGDHSHRLPRRLLRRGPVLPGRRVARRPTRPTVRAVTDCVVLALPAREFAAEFARWFPMAVHLLEGMLLGLQRGNQLRGERERLLALGKLSAGLTHELNNPAAAAGRATVALRDRVEGMRHKLAMIASGKLAGVQLKKLVDGPGGVRQEGPARAAAVRRWRPPTGRTSWATGSTTTTSAAAGSWRRSSSPAGWTSATWRRCTPRRTRSTLEGAIRWLAYTVETESLLREITDATTRISDLVLAAKQYSQMDRAPYQLDRRARGAGRHPGDVRPQAGGRQRRQGEDGQGLRPHPAADPGLPGRAEPGLDQHHRQRHRRDELRRHAHRAHPAATATACWWRSRTPARASRPTSGSGSSSRSSPPRRWARAPGWAWTSSYRVMVSRHHGDIRVRSEPGSTTFQVLLPTTEVDRG